MPTLLDPRRVMITVSENDYEAKLWAVLGREHLVDLSQFHKRNFFDEVPLFSRGSDIDFLSMYGSKRANSILLNFALKFLKAVVSYEEHRSAYFAAITVWSSTASELIVPNLFVWSGSIRRLQKKLVLDGVGTPFGRTIKRLVSGGSVATWTCGKPCVYNLDRVE